MKIDNIKPNDILLICKTHGKVNTNVSSWMYCPYCGERLERQEKDNRTIIIEEQRKAIYKLYKALETKDKVILNLKQELKAIDCEEELFDNEIDL